MFHVIVQDKVTISVYLQASEVMLLKTITIICAAIASAVMGIAVDDYGDVGPCPEGDGLLALPEYDLRSVCFIHFT